MTILLLSNEILSDLKLKAFESPRLRQHLNLHESYVEPSQRFLNAIYSNSYIRPHFHDPEQGNETLVVISGVVALLIFTDGGEILEINLLGSERHLGDQVLSVGAEIPPGTWHSVVAWSDPAVLLEIKSGPFDPDKPKHFASWAPVENIESSQKYLEFLRQAIAEVARCY